MNSQVGNPGKSTWTSQELVILVTALSLRVLNISDSQSVKYTTRICTESGLLKDLMA